MTKIVSATAVQALKEALCTIYWYKSDLRSFLHNTISDRAIVAHANWDGYKRQIVSDVVDSLCHDQEKYLGDIRRLFHEVAKMDSFRHLEQLDDGKAKAEKARAAVAELRRIVEIHDEATDEAKNIHERREKEAERLRNSAAVREKLDEIKACYMSLISSCAPHQRGFELERVLYELFNLFDLDPRASFRNVGEQIDGAFSMEGTDYLFEAKWHKDPCSIGDLDSFAGKVHRKLDNTLGLFLSINGFSEDGVRAHSTGRPVIVLMTGADLMAVVEERIDFVSLLLQKRKHAAQTGGILLQIHEMTD
ncbi:MAG: hypothetical protein K9N51_13985 [Candidatus Pacebacteria bacterium]|nr:hypothetical protein [Candidatus Paceibacterota bacterium]